MNPCDDDGFQARMEQAAKLAGNATRLAEKTGISRRAIGEYLAGKAEPSRPRLVAIAAAAGVRVEWLATGEGPTRVGEETAASAPVVSAVDKELLARVHKSVAEVYRSENARVSPEVMAGDVAGIYDELVAVYDTAEKRLVGLELELYRLRRDLQAPAATTSTKRVS